MIYQACITRHASEVGIGTRKFSDLEVFPELFELPSPLLPPCSRSTPRNILIFLQLQLFEFLLQLLPHPLDYTSWVWEQPFSGIMDPLAHAWEKTHISWIQKKYLIHHLTIYALAFHLSLLVILRHSLYPVPANGGQLAKGNAAAAIDFSVFQSGHLKMLVEVALQGIIRHQAKNKVKKLCKMKGVSLVKKFERSRSQ